MSIRDHLAEYLYPRIAELDMIVFGGDFFDSALTMNSDAGLYAAMIIDEVLALANEHRVFVRVVTGTFFHDRYQNRFFNIKGKRCDDIDGIPLVKVATAIELEFIKPLGLTMVYCPDDQPGDPTEQILETIRRHRVDEIDFLCSHGYYEYLLPKGIPHIPHNLIHYNTVNPYIRGCILNGHVHIPIVYKKLISGGSFERMAHGEEHDKGFFIIHYDKKTFKVTPEFVVNQHTIPFVTIPVHEYSSMETCLEYIENLINTHRLKAGDNAQLYIRLDGVLGTEDFVIRYLDGKYSNVVVSTKSKKVQEEDYNLNETINTLPVITEDNLPDLIYENIKDTGITIEQIKEFL